MSKDHFDGYLQLVPSKQMTTKIVGETLDAKRGSSDSGEPVAGIEIDSFSFGNAKSLKNKNKDDDDEEMTEEEKEKQRRQKEKAKEKKKKKKTIEEGYRFKITKELESASPTLMQAYFSNSYKRGRNKYNDFATATVIVRRAGASGERPKTYLSLTFENVRVVGYELEAEGTEPPVETVEFTFMTCEMKYRRQLKDGTLDEPKVVECDFKKHEAEA